MCILLAYGTEVCFGSDSFDADMQQSHADTCLAFMSMGRSMVKAMHMTRLEDVDKHFHETSALRVSLLWRCLYYVGNNGPRDIGLPLSRDWTLHGCSCPVTRGTT
eukprot:598826-Amphidinium_carterae.1